VGEMLWLRLPSCLVGACQPQRVARSLAASSLLGSLVLLRRRMGAVDSGAGLVAVSAVLSPAPLAISALVADPFDLQVDLLLADVFADDVCVFCPGVDWARRPLVVSSSRVHSWHWR
jgi:hypothetical protein